MPRSEWADRGRFSDGRRSPERQGARASDEKGAKTDNEERNRQISAPASRQEGEVGDGGDHEGLEKGLGPAAVARLSQAQLD